MFNWLFGTPRFRVYEDSFARTRNSTLAGLRKAISDRNPTSDNFLIVAHFAESFEELQDQLHLWEMDYRILSKPSTPEAISRNLGNSDSRIIIGLSKLLQPEPNSLPVDTDQNLCVMAIERHPYVDYDNRLKQFCREIPNRVELGYFLSFEDAAIKDLVNDATIRILDMFGMGENELITSNMISRRLTNVLNQNAKKYSTDHPADSAEDWIRLNGHTN